MSGDGVHPPRTTRGWLESLIKLAAVAAVIIGVVVAVRLTGAAEYISLEGLDRLRDWIKGFGVLAPVVFMVIKILATVAFLPGLPIGLLGGAIFGAVWGTLWNLIGGAIGATLALLIGRYAARGMVAIPRAEKRGLKTSTAP